MKKNLSCSKWFAFLTIFSADSRHTLNFSAVLIFLNFFLGLGEGVTFPVMHAMLAKWAPPLELSKMATFIYTGSTLGTIVSLPLTGIICDYLGWEAAFYIFGSCGILWFIFWAFLVYERPEQ